MILIVIFATIYTYVERDVVDDKQINCYKIITTISSVNVGASVSFYILSQSLN